MSPRQRVTIDGVETPVVLEGCGPKVTEADVGAFEKKLGRSLPADYRAFLLACNGGSPVVGVVNGRDDRPDVPYQHGDAVHRFYRLAPPGAEVLDRERLKSPAEHPWDLPETALPVATDQGGNEFVLCLDSGLVRFVDHEALDQPIEEHRVMAESFLDLLRRFRTLEEQARIDAEEKVAERRAIVEGPMPPAVVKQCEALKAKAPGLPAHIRQLFLAIYDAKGFFAVHADEPSRAVLDLVLWAAQNTDHPGGLTLDEVQDLLLSDWGKPEGGLGFSGFAPALIAGWWKDRKKRKSLVVSADRGKLTGEVERAIGEKVGGRGL